MITLMDDELNVNPFFNYNMKNLKNANILLRDSQYQIRDNSLNDQKGFMRLVSSRHERLKSSSLIESKHSQSQEKFGFLCENPQQQSNHGLSFGGPMFN